MHRRLRNAMTLAAGLAVRGRRARRRDAGRGRDPEGRHRPRPHRGHRGGPVPDGEPPAGHAGRSRSSCRPTSRRCRSTATCRTSSSTAATASCVQPGGTDRLRRPVVRVEGDDRAVQDPHARPPPERPGEVQRHRRGRVAQRHRRLRHLARLAVRARRADAPGLHLGRDLGAVGGRPGWGARTQEHRPGALRHAEPPG